MRGGLVACCLFPILLGGCGNLSTRINAMPPDVSGRWVVTYRNLGGGIGTPEKFRHELNLKQVGTSLTGTYVMATESIAVSGSVDNRTVKLTSTTFLVPTDKETSVTISIAANLDERAREAAGPIRFEYGSTDDFTRLSGTVILKKVD